MSGIRKCTCGCTTLYDVETTFGKPHNTYVAYSIACAECGKSTAYCYSRRMANEVWEEMTAPPAITHEQAEEALNSMDDYARMPLGVDAIGPREVLERYIKQQKEKV